MKFLPILFLFFLLFIAGCAETTNDTIAEGFDPYDHGLRQTSTQDTQSAPKHQIRPDDFKKL